MNLSTLFTSIARKSVYGAALAAALVVFVVAGACKSEAKPAFAAPSAVQPAAKDAATQFKLTVVHANLKSGATGDAKVQVKPGDGFKWNKEYPAAFKLSDKPTKVAVSKTEWKQLAGDFAVDKDGKWGVVIPMTAVEAGAETIKGELRFSICDKTTCLIKKETVAIALKVD